MAFSWFGVFWSSIIKLNVLYILLTYSWMYAVTRKVFENRLLALILVITCETTSMVLTSYWWYNPVTSITVELYVACIAAVLLRPDTVWLWLSLCLSLLLTALMKPNMSGIAIIGGTFALLWDPKTRWRTLAVSLAAFLLWLDLLYMRGVTITQVLGGYLSVISRVNTSGFFGRDWNLNQKFLAWSCAVAMIPIWVRVAWFRSRLRQQQALLVLAGFGFLVSIYGFYSNVETKLMDLSLGIVSGAILVGQMQAERRSLRISAGWISYLILVCSIFTFTAIGEAITRDRLQGMGMGLFYEYHTEDAPLNNSFFTGMRAGHNLHVTVNAISSLCASRHVEHIFFGPRLEWAYAAFHIASPKRQPSWWDPGVSFPIKDEKLYVTRWIDAQFNPVVLLDLYGFEPDLLHSISQSYVLDQQYPLNPVATPLLILSRKK